MNDPIEQNSNRRSYTLLAWLVILGVCGFKITDVVMLSLGLRQVESEEVTRVISLNDELMGKIVVGGAQLSPESTSMFMAQIEPLKEGTPDNRLAFAILTAEVEGAEAGQAAFDDEIIMNLAADPEAWTEHHLRLHALLGELLADRGAGHTDLPSLDEDEREEIYELAGWLGAIALNPADGSDPARRSSLIDNLSIIPIVFGVVLVVLGGFCLGGLVGLIILLIRAKDRKAWHGFEVPGPEGGGIYLETFAVWIALFLGYQYLSAYVIKAKWLSADLGTTVSLAGFFVSLLALAWPVVRGVSWRQVREDIGWTTGRGLFRESLGGGLGGYALALPICGIGFLLVLLLLQVQEYLLPDAPAPSHPAQALASSGDLWIVIQLYILACIAAPIAEETMFRGVLFRYFREVSHRWSLALSFLFSALATSFIFAAIHPQGLATIPALMGLAIGFCLIREWRGSLLAPMVAHGLNNFLIISLNVALFGLG